MEETENSTPESLFSRASKRRKVFRKRNTEGDAPSDALTATSRAPSSPGLENEDSAAQRSVVRRPAAKKHGIAFSSSGVPAETKGPSDMQMVLVPVAKHDEAEVVQTDRFMKPIGKVVVEDKHLTAYVDSKLAELRSSTSTPTLDGHLPVVNALPDSNGQSAAYNAALTSGATTSTEPNAKRGTSNAQSRAQAHADRMRQKQRRRQPQIDPSSTARGAMVDRIMQESQVPMYDRPSAAATSIDSDEAAAAAFKAEFLAGLEEQNRRKPPAPPSAARGAQNAAPATGPKLGGSRSQREKMKALEEAKASGARK